MKSKACEDWTDLYNDELIEVWHQEREEELKKSSMLLFVLRKELNRIQKQAESDVAKTRRRLQYGHRLTGPSRSSSTSVQEIKYEKGKENIEHHWASTGLGIKPLDDTGSEVESPEIFQILSPTGKPDSEDISKQIESSPTIKKRIKRPKNPFRQNLTPSLLLGTHITENSHTPSKSKKHYDLNFNTPKNSVVILDDEANINNAIIDSTIIESTPCVSSSKKSIRFGQGKRCSKQSSVSLKKAPKQPKSTINDTTRLPDHTNTQTQMMSQNLIKIEPKNEDISVIPKDDELQSSMDISDILAYVDKHSLDSDMSIKNITGSAQIRDQFLKTTNSNLKPPEDKLSQKSDSSDFDCVIVERKDIKTVLKGEHKYKQNQFKRNQMESLDGWSCSNCKTFYEKLDIASGDLERKMQQCFKLHRTYEPAPDTYAGFWDMGMPKTPESQQTNDQSTIFRP